MITRRDFLKVTGAAAAAAALTACGGSSSTASSAASGTASSAASSAVAKLDKVKVAVPNDTTNEARALTLLEKNGFFKLKADAGLTATAKDIEENPLNVSVDEVEAAQVPNGVLLLVDAAIDEAAYCYIQNPQSVCHTQVSAADMLRHRSRMYHTYKELCIQLGVYDKFRLRLHGIYLSLFESPLPNGPVQKLSDAFARTHSRI